MGNNQGPKILIGEIITLAIEDISTNSEEVRNFLESVDKCNFGAQKPLSLGQDYKISGNGLKGSTLLYNNYLIYMNFFSRQEGFPPGEPMIRDEITLERTPGLTTGFHRAF